MGQKFAESANNSFGRVGSSGGLHLVVQSDLRSAIRAPERGCQRRVKGESYWIWKLEGETLVEVWIPA